MSGGAGNAITLKRRDMSYSSLSQDAIKRMVDQGGEIGTRTKYGDCSMEVITGGIA